MKRKAIMILALDQSTSNVGFCVFDDKKYEVSGCKEVHKSAEKKQYEYEWVDRAFYIVINLIATYKPDFVVIEKVYAGKNMATLKWLATLKGRIEGYCLYNKIKTDIVYPTSWKSFIKLNGKREGAKLAVKDFFSQRYNISIKTDDESDAIGIAYYYANKCV